MHMTVQAGALRHGVDLVQTRQVRRFPGDALDIVFTGAELAACHRWRDPWPHLAECLAVKEGVLKALGTGWSHGLRWTEVSTVLHPGQPPRVHLLGEVAAMARASGHPDVIAAVSHTDTWAMAYVLLVGEEGAAPPGR